MKKSESTKLNRTTDTQKRKKMKPYQLRNSPNHKPRVEERKNMHKMKKMTRVHVYLSVIALIVNRLNPPNKIYRLVEWL
jgi:hypothetical protein